MLTQDDIKPGVEFEVKNNTKLAEGPKLMIMAEDCDGLGPGGFLEPGTKLTIDCPLDNRAVPTAKTVAFTIEGYSGVYTTFWSYFKPRVTKL